MALEQKEVTEQEAVEHNNQMEASKAKLNDIITSGDVFKSLDLPTAEPVAEPEPKTVVEEAISEASEEAHEEAEGEAPEPAKAEEDEELVPKSKVQKRFDALTAEKRRLEQELEQVRSSHAEPKDDLTRKLEAMSEAELKAAKREARIAQAKYRDDDDQLSKLVDLEERIEETMKNAPQRMAQEQEKYFKVSARNVELSAAEDGVDLVKSSPEIIKYAQEIYQNTPSFQASKTGQGEALKLAYRHYREISRLGGNKVGKSEEVNRLKSQVNNLKKRTTLDTKVVKGNMDKVNSGDLRRKAMSGTLGDKYAFIQNDPLFKVEDMIPSEYRE